jgi:hypothetical protein
MERRFSAALQGSLLAICMVTLFSGFTFQKYPNLAKWEKFDFAKQAIKPEQIQSLSLKELSLLRGIVFGKHGRIFREQDIQNFLYSREWYQVNDEFKNSLLNDTERKNIDLIREAESKKHTKVEPGDLRFYRDRVITRELLGKHSLAELHIMRAEIEAIHGKRFDDEPMLQTYFEERYWYAPVDKYDPKTLTETERKNLALIATATKEQRNLKLAPGDMSFFQNRSLTEDLLKGLSLHELRILRNEIYALRGRQFRTPWLAEYFYAQDWYKPMDDFGEPELSASEKKNIETIVAYENRIHEDLSARVITRDLIDGMFLEDASKLRNEIYARRGKVFKDKWLNKYYASFAWYKANPSFTEASLTATEKRNIATIKAYEKQAMSVWDAVEG